MPKKSKPGMTLPLAASTSSTRCNVRQKRKLLTTCSRGKAPTAQNNTRGRPGGTRKSSVRTRCKSAPTNNRRTSTTLKHTTTTQNGGGRIRLASERSIDLTNLKFIDFIVTREKDAFWNALK